MADESKRNPEGYNAFDMLHAGIQAAETGVLLSVALLKMIEKRKGNEVGIRNEALMDFGCDMSDAMVGITRDVHGMVERYRDMVVELTEKLDADGGVKDADFPDSFMELALEFDDNLKIYARVNQILAGDVDNLRGTEESSAIKEAMRAAKERQQARENA